jgi:hypothetical protein
LTAFTLLCSTTRPGASGAAAGAIAVSELLAVFVLLLPLLLPTVEPRAAVHFLAVGLPAATFRRTRARSSASASGIAHLPTATLQSRS